MGRISRCRAGRPDVASSHPRISQGGRMATTRSIPKQRPRTSDTEVKARHRAMWASGDYPSMVETFLLPLGPRLVQASDIGPGMRVLDVAAGTGNASIPAAQLGASVTASDLTPELLEAGRRPARAPRAPPAGGPAGPAPPPLQGARLRRGPSPIAGRFAPPH